MNPKILAIPIALLVVLVAALGAVRLGERREAETGKAGPAPARAATSGEAPRVTLPVAKGRPVLRILGVPHGNAGAHTTKLDLATLERIGGEQVRVFEPFLKREVTFTGIRMAELLRILDVPAGKLYMHALDDYHVDLSVGELSSVGFLATRSDGRPIAIAKGGPIRLLLTGKGKLAANADNWIWSIDWMRAHG